MSLNKEQLVASILGFDISIGNLENQLKQLKKNQIEAERQLVEIMETEGLTSYSDESGRKVNRADKMFITIRADQKELWFSWVESLGRSDLIKTDINKNSLNALVKKAIRGTSDGIELPDFFDMQRDLFFIPHIEIKLGAKSLRKAAAETIEELAVSSQNNNNF